MKSNEIPTAIIAIASKRPATINILVCRLDANSGWRADDSKNLPPKIASRLQYLMQQMQEELMHQ